MSGLALTPDLNDVGGTAMTDSVDHKHTAPKDQPQAARPPAPVHWRYNAWSTPVAAQRALRNISLAAVGLVLFILLWQATANSVDTSLGRFPGPLQVISQAQNMVDQYHLDQQRRVDFFARQQLRNDELLRIDPEAQIRIRAYTGRPTFLDQIVTSLTTVAVGFALAMLVAIPLGIVCGLSESVYSALNPLIQLLKPVSPLAWLPLVTMLVSALYASDDPMFDKSFLISAITVALCCLWPTVINTAVGVANVDKDLISVSRVLRLPTLVHIRKIVLPAAIPLIFTGMRLSLATGWMVLIAAEMLAQNPGLGKFIWDEFQNGSSDSLSAIIVAAIVIGLIGLTLDKLMLGAQRLISWDKHTLLR